MPQSKFLVDTNSYFRLAKSIHPLLFTEFGEKKHCLYILPELDAEFRRNSSLQTKFAWALQPEYTSNRSVHPTLSRKQRSEVELAQGFIWDHVQAELVGPSRIDALYLSYGYVLKIPVVTDDKDMRTLATAFDIQTMVSLELLKIMLDCGHINRGKVKEIYGYWEYSNDIPYNAKADLARLFGTL
jgi:hypothetical protein